MARDVHGNARLEGDQLTITTMAKRGKKYVPNVRVYTVRDCRPDPGVASPAYALETPDGEVWHCGANEFGVFCDCPDHHFRRQNDRTPCKHCKAMIAVGLLPPQPGIETGYTPSNEPLPE